jgi:hypothetical protein
MMIAYTVDKWVRQSFDRFKITFASLTDQQDHPHVLNSELKEEYDQVVGHERNA